MCPDLLPAWHSQAQNWPRVLGMPEAFVLETRGPGARSDCSQASLGFCKRLLNALLFQDRLGGATPLPGFPVVSGMASLVDGSNKNPESHLLVRS